MSEIPLNIKSLFRFLRDSGSLTEDVARRLIPLHTEHKEPRVLSKAEYTALLRACVHHPRDPRPVWWLAEASTNLYTFLLPLCYFAVVYPYGVPRFWRLEQLRVWHQRRARTWG